MMKKNKFDTSLIMYRSDELMDASPNRYQITVEVAKRAKQRRFEDFDNLEDTIKPVLRAIIEMSDEVSHGELISD
jgi:DNA-directed RNA polymerase subunit omega